MLNLQFLLNISPVRSHVGQNLLVYGQQYLFCSHLFFLKFALFVTPLNVVQDTPGAHEITVQKMPLVVPTLCVPTILTLVKLVLQQQKRLFISCSRVKLKVDGNNAFFLLAPGTSNIIEISFGFSHHVCYIFPSTFKVKISGRKNKILTLQTSNNILLHNFCSQVVKTKKLDLYRHTGVTFGFQRSFTKKGKKKFV